MKTGDTTFYVVETKGREDLDDRRKIKRLGMWCKDVNSAQDEYTYTPIYIKQEKWEDIKNDLKSFAEVAYIFTVKENTEAL